MRRLSGPTATPCPRSRFDFLDQRVGIEHDPIADDGELARPDHARRQQRELVGDPLDDQRVPGIVAAPKRSHTISAWADSQSTILPLPSSPHWDPTTTTFAIQGTLTRMVGLGPTMPGSAQPEPPVRDKG